MKNYILSLLTILSLIDKSQAKSIQGMFNNGDYEGVIETINSSRHQLKNEEKIYLAGLSAFRLRQYDLFISYFEKISEDKFKDKNYLLGQVYYSMKDLKKSANFFKKSLKYQYKEDASLYYLGTIHKELGLYNDAKKYFTKIHDVSFPDLNFIQAAHHQVGLLYLDGYVKTKTLSKRVIRKKVLPKLVQAIKSAPKLTLAEVVRDDIRFIKEKYLGDNRRKPINVSFNQFFNYNTNVIYQSLDPTINNNASSALSNSVLNINYDYRLDNKREFQNIFNVNFNHQYHLEQDDPNIARYDGWSMSLQNQFLLNRPFQKVFFPLWVSIGGRYQAMNNELSGSLVFDNRSYFLSIGNQFKFFNIKPSIEFKFEDFSNFTSLNNQRNYSASTIIPYSLNQYLNFYLIGEIRINEFTNSTELSNYQLNGTLAHVMYIDQDNKFTTRGFVSLIDTREMREQRGYEVLLSPEIIYERKLSRIFNLSLNYRFEKKISKDESTFAYDQHIAGISIGVNYE